MFLFFVSLLVCSFACLFVCLFVCLFAGVFVCYTFVCMFVVFVLFCLFISLFRCLFVSLFVWVAGGDGYIVGWLLACSLGWLIVFFLFDCFLVSFVY